MNRSSKIFKVFCRTNGIAWLVSILTLSRQPWLQYALFSALVAPLLSTTIYLVPSYLEKTKKISLSIAALLLFNVLNFLSFCYFDADYILIDEKKVIVQPNHFTVFISPIGHKVEPISQPPFVIPSELIKDGIKLEIVSSDGIKFRSKQAALKWYRFPKNKKEQFCKNAEKATQQSIDRIPWNKLTRKHLEEELNKSIKLPAELAWSTKLRITKIKRLAEQEEKEFK